jgi:hypothetical protein
MRKGSVALVPLFLAIMVLFWFIAFMGGANDNLHAVNNVEHLRHLQGQLLRSAMEQRYKLEEEARVNGVVLSEDELNQKVNNYINFIMVQNNIQNPTVDETMQNSSSEHQNQGGTGNDIGNTNSGGTSGNAQNNGMGQKNTSQGNM